MIKGVPVVDATVHAFNMLPSNYLAPFLPQLMQMLYHGAHLGFHPRDTDKYNLTWDEFIESFNDQPELLADVVFRESPTDFMVYHGVPLEGTYRDGSSPIWVAKKVRERHPGRVFIYGPLYPWREDALDEIDRMVEEDGIVGIKFYPVDLDPNGERLRPSRLDTDAAMRCVERAQARGLKMIAVHKAVPLGPIPLAPYGSMYDMPSVVEAFPNITFEIVHGGAAFLEETVALLEKYKNVAINLETLPGFIHHPDMAKIWTDLMTSFLRAGAADRIFWATGAVGNHPQALLEGFMNFQLPDGEPQMTDEIRADILGRNFARHIGWDLDEMVRSTPPLQRPELPAQPWSGYRQRRAAGAVKGAEA